MPTLSLDRILRAAGGSGRAVLVDDQGNEWEIPAASLPEGSAEGDVLDIRLRKRKGAARELQNEIKDLQDKLKNLKKEQ